MFCAESAGTIHLIDSLISFLYFEGRGTNIFFLRRAWKYNPFARFSNSFSVF
jgi:hypothetical protein